MRNYIFPVLVAGLMHILYSVPATAQISSIDSLTSNLPLKNAVLAYNKATRETNEVFNGKEYIFYDHTIIGNAYFPVFSWRKGSVTYDGYNYYNVYLLYDTYKDLVVPRPNDNAFMLSLVSEKLTSFTIENHNFKRIITDTTNKILETGFYEVLYPGKTEVLAKRYKSIQSMSATEKFFDESDSYYLKKNSSYYKISSKGSVLNLLKDKKSDLQGYARKNGLAFKDKEQKEQSFIKMASYYDQLNK